MGLITKNVYIKVNGHNLLHYKNKGYNCNKNDIILVDVHDLTNGCSSLITYSCDYCGKEVTTEFFNKIKTIHNNEKFCCKDGHCQCLKREELFQEKYGVKNPMQLSFNVNKAKNTCIERYGVDNPYKNKNIQEKAKNTNLERYGVENPLSNKDIQEKVKNTNLQKYGVEYPTKNPEVRNKIKETLIKKYNVTNPFLIDFVQEKLKSTGRDGSKIQKYICETYEGVLSKNIGVYIADIVIDDNIICEVDGGGHTLKIKFGKETDYEFYNKEYGREKYLISMGYKIFRIITDKDFLPSKDFLYKIQKIAYIYFNIGYNVFRYYIDKNSFTYY